MIPYYTYTPSWFITKDVENKKDLKKNDIIYLRNGDKLVYYPRNDGDYGQEFFDIRNENDNSLTDRSDLNDDLTHINNSDYDIVKIERVSNSQTVYSRKNKAREMTVEEISEKLGYEVKIVKKK